MQPIIIEDNISVAAGDDVSNVIASNPSLSRYLRCPFPAAAKLLAVISATGLRIAMDYGSKNVVDLSDVRVGTDLQDPIDVINDEFYPEGGDQLALRAINTTGGALSLRYRIVLAPLEDMGVSEIPPDTRVLQRLVSIADGSVDTDVLAGSRYERPKVDSLLKLFGTASAAGLTRQVYVETTNVAPASAIAPLNRMPQDPFDVIAEGIQIPADNKTSILFSNSSGGALTAFWKAKFAELVRT